MSVQTTNVKRRSFLKWSGAVAGGSALVASGVAFNGTPGVGPDKAVAAADGMEGADKTIWNSCTVNCGSRCPVRLQVKDDTIVRVLGDNTGDDEIGTQQIRACVRGRSIRQRIYSPDRLKTPLKRKPGTPRGGGEWIEITWEEAYDEIAKHLKLIKEKCGNEAIYVNYGTGTLGATMACSWPPNNAPFARLMNCWGGYLRHYNTYSSAQITSATPYTYGKSSSNNSNDSAAHSQLQVWFGYNPLEIRMSGGGETFVTQQTKKKSGVRTIIIDPRYTDTAVDLADEWIPIRPGTDAALASAIAYVLITENLHDQEFLDKYVSGFDEAHMPAGIPAGNSYRSYILGEGVFAGEGDATKGPKTPDWAADITGVPADTIVRLAREIGTAKPACIAQGLGPQRHRNGENTVRAIQALAILTGNVGILGGGIGNLPGAFSMKLDIPWFIDNPVESTISFFHWTDAIYRGKDMKEETDGLKVSGKFVPNFQLKTNIQFIWNYGGNALINQHSDHNATIEILRGEYAKQKEATSVDYTWDVETGEINEEIDDTRCKMIVGIDNVMTSSAEFCDILLPDVTGAEQMDLVRQGQSGTLGYLILADKAIEPLFNTKTTFEMCSEIAKRLDDTGEVYNAFTEGRTQEEWIRHILDVNREKNDPNIPTFEKLLEDGIYRTLGKTVIPFKDFREDPVNNPLETPSGKIELFSSALWELNQRWILPEEDQGGLTALPQWVEAVEGAMEARTNEKYPLQCIGHHYKARTHSSYGNVEWMKEAHHQQVWINPIDAEARGIKQDDMVAVFNDRGRLQLPAKVTIRIAPGVTSVPQGAWYKPDEDGVDHGGSINMVTTLACSPLAKGNPQHTNLVQIEKV